LRCPPLMRASPSTGREAVAGGRSAWPASLAVLGVCATLAALLFLGAWRSPSQRWAGGSGDPVLFLWFIRWRAYAWARGNSPFMLAEGAGHLHLMLAFTPPLVFLVLDELLVRQRHRPEVTALALGLLVATQVLISEEVAASEVLVAALAVIVLAALFPGLVRS